MARARTQNTGDRRKKATNRKSSIVNRKSRPSSRAGSLKSEKELKLNPADYIEPVRMAIVELGAINQRGDPAWEKIAKIVKVSRRMLFYWKTESSGYYHAGFAEMVEKAIALVDTGQSHRGLINLAKPHKVVKRIRQRKDTGPKPPPKSWNKAATLKFAEIVLGLEIDKEKTLPEIRLIIETECRNRAKTKLVVVREEVTEELDVAAAKFVLANYGPKDKRWLAREKTEHEAGGELADILRGWAGDKITLPSEEEFAGAKNDGDGRTDGLENEDRVSGQEQVLETEQPILHHG